jgi:hypothetical protein
MMYLDDAFEVLHESVEEALDRREADVREWCCELVQKNCPGCEGTGYGEPEQHPSGEGWIGTECPYCGPILSAIRANKEAK